MGFISFVGRVLFASIFLLSAYQDSFFPWMDALRRVAVTGLEPSRLRTGRGLGGDTKRPRFSEFGADGGAAASSLKPKFELFVKQVSKNIGMAAPHIDIKTVVASTMFLKAFGGLLFIISSSFGAVLLLVYLAFITPVVYDFYNYEMESQQFVVLFTKFSQNLALFGALLFFLGMKNSIPRRHSKRRTTKAKTN